ncbi:MAG TPA: alpha/beta fold hydrolase [Methylomirabilota bacterium]|jgi:pimeloyl-ACP methyl ester carboxylesterase|nr:alpha/beta fold hydrolase [Methylomirabilota bacterium]
MPKARVRDLEMFYIDVGSGAPVVLIMGFGGDHLAWGLQTPAFAATHRVIAFDNRGVGQTDSPDIPYTTAMMADDTVGLLDVLGIARVHVCGVSMGGMIAQEVALRHPERVLTLQLHATLARPDNYMRALSAAWRALRPGLAREEWMRTLALWLFAPITFETRPEFVEMVIQNALQNPYPQSLTGFIRQGDAVLSHDALDRLAQVRCPTLVSVAEHDILVPPRFSHEIVRRLVAAEFKTVADAGHAYMWERPDVFNAMCLDFVARHAS